MTALNPTATNPIMSPAWTALKNDLDAATNPPHSKTITPNDIPPRFAAQAAGYLVSCLIHARMDLDEVGDEAIAGGTPRLDLLQTTKLGYKVLEPLDIDRLTPNEARKYALVILEQIVSTFEAKRKIEERVKERATRPPSPTM